jgi:predicted nuclease of predicted toxin-antitoxin system
LRLPQLDFALVTQAGLSGSQDPTLLDWAPQEDRTILTHDNNTMIYHATQLLRLGEPMAGVILSCSFV